MLICQFCIASSMEICANSRLPLAQIAPNLRKFGITALCRFAKDGVVCRPVLVGAPFAPTQGLQFQALHSLSFRFICTLHWCKHCVAPNLRKFPISALCRLAAGGEDCRPVPVGAPFAPTQDLHFQALHCLSFRLICTLHWCNHCTGLEVDPNLSKFSISAL